MGLKNSALQYSVTVEKTKTPKKKTRQLMINHKWYKQKATVLNVK
jgi:hypothetical protein